MKLLNRYCLSLMLLLFSSFIPNAMAADNSAYLSVATAQNPQQAQTISLVKTYYDALNKNDMQQFFSVIAPNVIHNINQGPTEKGLDKFKKFMQLGNDSFSEKLSHIVIMVSNDGKYAAALWQDKGVYKKDFPGMEIKAKGQKYTLNGGHFFEIKNDKIASVTTYYNLTDFMQQIKK